MEIDLEKPAFEDVLFQVVLCPVRGGNKNLGVWRGFNEAVILLGNILPIF